MGECTYPNVNHGSSIIRAGRVFIYLPFKSFTNTVFSSLGRGGALLDGVWFPDTFWETPLPNLWSHMVQNREQGPIGMVWGEILGYYYYVFILRAISPYITGLKELF